MASEPLETYEQNTVGFAGREPSDRGRRRTADAKRGRDYGIGHFYRYRNPNYTIMYRPHKEMGK